MVVNVNTCKWWNNNHDSKISWCVGHVCTISQNCPKNLIILHNIQKHLTITKLQTTMMISKHNYVNLLLYLTFIDAVLFDQIIIK
jgi:hypothetical protein